MATVSQWTPFGVALDITATAGTVTRKNATQYTVVINVSWKTHWSGAQTTYGMTASSGGGSATINSFGVKASSGSGSFTGTYSISGNGSASKTVTVEFKNFNGDTGVFSTKTVSFTVTVPALASYTVSYNANGGSGAPSSQAKWKDQSITLSSTKPTRTGHTFQGWATSASGSVAYAAGATYSANANATLYAVWKAHTYTVAYNANGGSGAPGSQTKTHGVTLKLSGTIPTKANYNFLGWGTSASATTIAYTSGANYTANAGITLYAIWELAYTKPRITNLSVTRCDSVGTPKTDGTHARVNLTWDCDKTLSSIVIEWKLTTANSYAEEDRYTYLEPDPSITSSDFSEVIGNGRFSASSSYIIRVTVTDSVDSTILPITLSSQLLTIHARPGGNGIAFGKMSEYEGVMDIAYQTLFTGGLSHPLLEPETDLNEVLTPNIYIGENTDTYNYANCPLASGTFALVVIGMGSSVQIMQKLIVCSKTNSHVAIRFYYAPNTSNPWGDWQWENPLMNSGVEYCTTERWLNKPVYQRYIPIGAVSAGSQQISHGITGFTGCVSIQLTDGANNNITQHPNVKSLYVTKDYIYLTIDSAQTLNATIKYTKT